MKKTISILLLIAVAQLAIGQTETFDIISFTPPKDWKKDDKPGAVVYSQASDTTGKFCVIIVFASTAGTDDAEKDFTSQWDEMAVIKYAADTKPATEKAQTPDGWKTVTGASLIKIKGSDAYIVLTVFSGFGKKVTVISTLNDQSYLAQLETFLGTIKIDKTAPSAPKNNDAATNSSPGNTNISIIGTWSDYSGVMANYVSSSGVFLSSADSHEMHQFEFTNNKQFSYQYLGTLGSTLLYIKSNGTYSIQGEKLTLVTKKYESVMGSKGMTGTLREDKSKELTEICKYYIGPNKWEKGPFLNIHREGNYYPWSDFPYDYYKKVNPGGPGSTNIPATNPKKESLDNTNHDTNEKVNPPLASNTNIIEGKFGHLIYIPIDGWKQTNFSNTVAFVPTNMPANRYLETRIMESKPFSGDMKQAFEESWKDALQQLELISPFTTPYNIITEKSSYKGWPYIQGHGTVKRNTDTRDLSYDKYYVNLFVIKLNDRIERIVTFSLQNINGSDYSLYNNYTYRNAITELCFSVKFDDWKEKSIDDIKGSPLSGMYEGLKLGGGRLNGSYALFFPNGQVFFGGEFPTEGFDGKNTLVSAELDTRNWGTYSLQEGKGTINMGYGKMPLKVIGDNLVITTQNTDHTYEKLPSLDGAVINGKYAFDGNWGSNPPSVTFTADGKFIDEGALNILNHQTTDPDEFNITAKPGNGDYEIKNYTLICKYSDGRKFQMVFSGNGFDRKNSSPPSLTLSFNNDILHKK